MVYVENPQAGDWEVKVYGWNLRPKTGPPPSQDVSISVSMGSSTDIVRGSTIISMDGMQASLKQFVTDMDLPSGNDRVSYIVFGSFAEEKQGFTNVEGDLHNAIDNTGLQGGTAIQTGIEAAKDLIVSDARADVTNVTIILTDGQNDAGPAVAIAEANAAKALGITIFTVGLTNFVNEDMLKSIATKPEYYYYSPDASTLTDVYNQIATKIKDIRKERRESGTPQVLQILFLNDTSSYSIIEDDAPYSNSKRRYEYDLSGKISNVKEVRIFLGFEINGKIIWSENYVSWKTKS